MTVDGGAGEVHEGDVVELLAGPPATVVAASDVAAALESVARPLEPLATMVYVNLAIPEHAAKVAALPVDGVGLLRAEFMMTEALGGEHPQRLLARGEGERFVARMSAALLEITRAFAPRPVVCRTMDFRSNEFRGLTGGAAYEPAEENPMIGFRGCYRYIRDPELFALELRTLARVRDETPNLHLMIPFVPDALGARGVPGRRRRQPAGSSARTAPLGDGRGAVDHLPHPRVRGDGCRRRVDRLERPDSVDAGCRPRLGDLRGAVRRGRRGGARRHPPDHRRVSLRGHHVVAVRPGAVEPSGDRRAAGGVRHHIGVSQPRRRRGRTQRHRTCAERRLLLAAARASLHNDGAPATDTKGS